MLHTLVSPAHHRAADSGLTDGGAGSTPAAQMTAAAATVDGV